MFVYQSGFGSPCRPCNRETFEAMINNPTLKASIEAARACLAKGDTKGYDSIKRGLPAFCFMATFAQNKGKNGTRPENTWRLQSAAHLNGLVMLDFDHLDKDPREVFASLPEHMRDDDCDSQILLAHVTPSGKGLRLVCKADAKRGNLADNQQYLSRCFKLECDASVKNADRLSFAVPASEIIYLDNQLFTYQNEEYDKLFGPLYRRGDSRAATPRPSRGGVAAGRGGVCNILSSEKIQTPPPAPPLEGRGETAEETSPKGRGGDTSQAEKASEKTGVQGNCPLPTREGLGESLQGESLESPELCLLLFLPSSPAGFRCTAHPSLVSAT